MNQDAEVSNLKHTDSHDHSEAHDHHDGHAHTHGVIDPSLVTTERGIWAVKWSLVALAITALLQVLIFILSGSIALLADTIHNIGDAMTAIPLWIAFVLARRKPSPRFTYGYGRVEDMAGVLIVLIILFSAVVAGYESVNRFFNPQPVQFLWAVAAAAIIGFLGNEAVAIFRIRVGREIKSAALVADGYHARIDGLTSLGVLAGAIGVWLGFPLADPIVGLLITLAILRIVWDAGKVVFTRLLDGVNPEIVDEIRHAAQRVSDVCEVTDVRARWLGHRLHAEINLAAVPNMSVAEGHDIALQARHELMHHLPYLSGVTIHVDPEDASGEVHHSIQKHTHQDLPPHAHP